MCRTAFDRISIFTSSFIRGCLVLVKLLKSATVLVKDADFRSAPNLEAKEAVVLGSRSVAEMHGDAKIR